MTDPLDTPAPKTKTSSLSLPGLGATGKLGTTGSLARPAPGAPAIDPAEASKERMAARWKSAGLWLLAATQANDTDALFELAELFVMDLPDVGTPKDAADIYESLARDLDSARARRSLAELALEGVGMAKDPAKAQVWLLADAERGDHESETLLAMGYFRGSFGEVAERACMA